MLQRRNIHSLVFAGLLPFALAACSDDSPITDPRTQSPYVRAVEVEANGKAERSFTGVVAARVQSDLGFRVSGKIQERLVDTGQTVERGQPLMRIDPTDLELAAHAQEEAVAAARARARQTTEDEARYRDLVARGAVSASAYDSARAAAETARADLAAAEARADVARNETDYAVLHADADGVVVETLAEPGQVVAAGQTVVRVAHAGPREALIDLPETLRPAIGSTARATLYGREQTEVTTLRQLSDAADPLTRTFEARYVLEGKLAEAPLGSTVSVAIQADTSASAMQVPIGALFDPGKGPGVWLIEGETPRVTWHAVQVIDLGEETATVAGDLETGDRVVALGAHLLHEGEQVQLDKRAMTTGLATNRGEQP
ncbi:efflux RND transporter periplasmic adaptor subunit [Halomonas sp. Mc5H-6]|uniref:efflux RND transporter periplasmic adaptor subunit n=1 Tax=Halomonas sp. Mc5H-6 TaxID=2954500 RepID=UPI002097DC8D|nr:efflux RND transporter periplasmic adaptor subunit [Halomonas sp. Mc5H-6]MCO7247301.1 efflux RND transporter periplasmic adaptor subunit [Halomonas sp. Mc5H-6]